METTEQRGLERFWFRMEQARKAMKSFKPHSRAQLITRRPEVQVLPPQPKVLGFQWKFENFLYFYHFFRQFFFAVIF